MKITDVSLTLFAWDDIPPTQYGLHSRFAGSSALGLLRIQTDDGVEGHAFLGSASNAATTDGQGLITHLKPVLKWLMVSVDTLVHYSAWFHGATFTFLFPR
ncbi:MAG: hypothetical protein NTV97_16185, partial [Alphaproteobacteria bacterium]|nr:hypothetical protein [Alphaproteobacteria bacterium]